MDRLMQQSLQDPLTLLKGNPFLVISAIPAFALFIYISYYRFYTPASRYPGPFLASISNVWQALSMYSGDSHRNLSALHDKHGDIVRIGPNRLSIISPDVMKNVYLAGSTWLKSSFYDGFTAVIPNAFGTQDEDFHRKRRRQLTYVFSQANVLAMEEYMNTEMRQFRGYLERAAETGQPLDLKSLIHWLVIDVLGDLGFGKSFGMLACGDNNQAPHLEYHLRVGSIGGTMPWLLPYIRKYGKYMPIKWVSGAVEARDKLKKLAAQAVDDAINHKSDRKDILGVLVDAVDTETGKPLSRIELEAEAFGFIIAGTHTTTVTMGMLCAYLLEPENAKVQQKLVSELDSMLAPIPNQTEVYPYKELGDRLPYFTACLKETHRKAGVFNMPLYRIVPPGGAMIAGEFIPAGVEVATCNYAVHRNKNIFGLDV